VLLGKGGFGMVLEGKNAEGETFAVKHLCVPSEWHAGLAVAESDTMAQLGSRCSAILMPYSPADPGVHPSVHHDAQVRGQRAGLQSACSSCTPHAAPRAWACPSWEALVVFREMLRGCRRTLPCPGGSCTPTSSHPTSFITRYPAGGLPLMRRPAGAGARQCGNERLGLAITTKQLREGRLLGRHPGVPGARIGKCSTTTAPRSDMFSLESHAARAHRQTSTPEAGGFFFDSEEWDSVSDVRQGPGGEADPPLRLREAQCPGRAARKLGGAPAPRRGRAS